MPSDDVCRTSCAILLAMTAAALADEQPTFDDAPGKPGEWGFRPAPGSTSQMTPPGFTWRPQQGATSYELHVARSNTFETLDYQATGIAYNCHCPPKVLAPGTWYWRVRFADKDGHTSGWSRPRVFTIAD